MGEYGTCHKLSVKSPTHGRVAPKFDPYLAPIPIFRFVKFDSTTRYFGTFLCAHFLDGIFVGGEQRRAKLRETVLECCLLVVLDQLLRTEGETSVSKKRLNSQKRGNLTFK